MRQADTDDHQCRNFNHTINSPLKNPKEHIFPFNLFIIVYFGKKVNPQNETGPQSMLFGRISNFISFILVGSLHLCICAGNEIRNYRMSYIWHSGTIKISMITASPSFKVRIFGYKQVRNLKRINPLALQIIAS